MKIIVTAAAGDLGQSVIKALRLGSRKYYIIGTDLKESMIARSVCDDFHIIPSAQKKEDYIETIEGLCKTNSVSAVIPCNEVEIETLHDMGRYPSLENGAKVICQSREVLDTHGDKLLSYQFLRSYVKIAHFADAKSPAQREEFLANVSYPFFLKERKSSGSKGVIKIDSEASFEKVICEFVSPVVQEYLAGDEQEYSVGVFKYKSEVRAISFRRSLGPVGCSWYAELDQNEDVLHYCKAIAESIDFEGSVNIQVRVTSKGPLLLEINTRFSSLCAARAACGFNDVEWSLSCIDESLYPEGFKIPVAFKFERYISEMISIEDGQATGMLELEKDFE